MLFYLDRNRQVRIYDLPSQLVLYSSPLPATPPGLLGQVGVRGMLPGNPWGFGAHTRHLDVHTSAGLFALDIDGATRFIRHYPPMHPRQIRRRVELWAMLVFLLALFVSIRRDRRALTQ